MSQLQEVNRQIEDLLNGCLSKGLLDDQFMQLMQLQVRPMNTFSHSIVDFPPFATPHILQHHFYRMRPTLISFRRW